MLRYPTGLPRGLVSEERVRVGRRGFRSCASCHAHVPQLPARGSAETGLLAIRDCQTSTCLLAVYIACRAFRIANLAGDPVSGTEIHSSVTSGVVKCLRTAFCHPRDTAHIDAPRSRTHVESHETDMALVCLSMDGPAFDVNQITRL